MLNKANNTKKRLSSTAREGLDILGFGGYNTYGDNTHKGGIFKKKM